MIQFNLLPDVKLQFISARSTRRRVTFLAGLTIAISMFVLAMLIVVVFVWQGARLGSLDDSIKKNAKELGSKTDINKVLTIQSQLKSIDALHDAKPEVARVFSFLTQVTPSETTIATLSVNFVDSTMSLSGQSTNLEEVNKFVDTLKFTTITRGGEAQASDGKAFSQVVLTSYGLDSQGASFTIALKYDLAIFNSSETDLTLTVPKITSTRSETERPAELFQENVTPLQETSP